MTLLDMTEEQENQVAELIDGPLDIEEAIEKVAAVLDVPPASVREFVVVARTGSYDVEPDA